MLSPSCFFFLMSARFFLSRSRPVDFRCTIMPRDDRAKELIIAANMAG